MTMQDGIDARIQAYYSDAFDEHLRLTTRSPQGPLEFARTQEIVRSRVTEGRVLDVGGGAGVHAIALARAGYRVELVDPVPRHIRQARENGLAARIGDARELPFAAGWFDAALMLGPLYHLASRADRLRALREVKRVVRPGGFVFAGALSRYIALGMATLGTAVSESDAGELTALVAHGQPVSGLRFPAGHFHTAEELQAETEEAGLEVVEVVGVEGPAGALLESLTESSEELAAAALTVARAAATVPGVRDMSAHLVAVARVPDDGAAGVSPSRPGADGP